MLRYFLTVGAIGMAAALVGCEEDLNDRDRLGPDAPYRDEVTPLPDDDPLYRDDLRRDELRRDELRDDLRDDDLRGDLNRRDDDGVRVRWPGGGVDVVPRDRDRDLRDDRLERGTDIDIDRIDEDRDHRERRSRIPDVDVDVRNR